MDAEDKFLRCETVWHGPRVNLPGFESLCRQLICAPDMDLPGRVLERRESLWVDDIICDPEIPRALMAAKEGIRSSLCVPITAHGEIFGVLEYLSRDRRARDEELMPQMRAAAGLSGRFMQLKQVEGRGRVLGGVSA